MNDLPFGIESKNTYAALTPSDLQSLGKRASVAYLMGGTSLNDAIIKLAREYPSISPHQVQRVVEYANQETFAKLFADNEKYASDKNIEFDVADPGVVLMELNNGARPAVMSVPPDEYSSSPVKLAHSNVEADIELARVFGVDPALPGSEFTGLTKVAEDGRILTIERILPTKEANANGDTFDHIFSVGKMKHANLVSGIAAQPAATAQAPQAPVQATQPPADDGNTHNEQMLELQREIELAKKRQELQKVEQQTMDAMNPQGQPGMPPAPGPAMPGPDAGAAATPEQQAAGPVEAAPPPEMQLPPEQAGAIAVPPGSEPIKTGSLSEQALAYAKSGRPHSELLIKAAEASVSLGAIKSATVERGSYPMANPWGEVIRSKQKLARLLEDVTYARGKNTELWKEAAARFQKAVAEHMWNGGNLGEVAHLMGAVPEQSISIKTAMGYAVDELTRQGLDLTKARADVIQYEMEKGASTRVANLKHPIAEAYADLCKVAHGSTVLDEAHSQIRKQYSMVEKALQEAMIHADSF